MDNLGTLKELLTVRLSDPDAQVRGAAIHGLAYSDAPNPAAEAALLRQLSKEPNDQLKAAIIDAMNSAGYDSNTFGQAVIGSVLNPSDYVRDAAAKAAAKIKPPGALPMLAEALERYRQGTHFAVDAIASYGVEARAYLPQLEKLADDESIPDDLRDRARRAIEAIKNPQPAANTEPKAKAVALIDASPPQPATNAPDLTASSPAAPAVTPNAPPSPPIPIPTTSPVSTPSSAFLWTGAAVAIALLVGLVVFWKRRV